jgi:Tol biopolymer transport system component
MSRASDTITGRAPSWSPDGKAVAVMRDKSQDEPGQTLVIHSLDTGEERSYTHDGIALSTPLWFHDGKRVLVSVADKVENPDSAPGSAPAQGAWYAVDRQTGSWIKVLDADRQRGPIVAIAPDDKTIYYMAKGDAATRGFALYVALNLVTGQRTEIFDAAKLPKGPFGFGSVSPDGRMWAVRGGTKDSTYIGVIATDGGGYRELSNGSIGTNAVGGLQWSSDSRTLQWAEPTSSDDGSARGVRVMRIAVAGGPAEFTGIEMVAPGIPLLSPEGSRVAFATSTQIPNELWALDNITGTAKAPR